MCEQCFLCRSLVFCQTCAKCPNSCKRSACRGQTKPVLGNLGSLGCQTKGLTNVERVLHPPFLEQTKLDKVTDYHKLLCKAPQALHQPMNKNAVELVKNRESLGFYNILCCHRQHHTGCLHKQRVADEVGPSVCPSVENPDLLCQKTGYFQSLTHSRLADCGSRQAIQARPDHSNRVVSPPRGLPSNMQKVALASDRLFCNKVQQQTGSICVTSPGPLWPGQSMHLACRHRLLYPHGSPKAILRTKLMKTFQIRLL